MQQEISTLQNAKDLQKICKMTYITTNVVEGHIINTCAHFVRDNDILRRRLFGSSDFFKLERLGPPRFTRLTPGPPRCKRSPHFFFKIAGPPMKTGVFEN